MKIELTEWQKRKLEAEASKFPDIELMGFVSRGNLIVLQTSGDHFEIMSKEEKLKTLDAIAKSIEALTGMVIYE